MKVIELSAAEFEALGASPRQLVFRGKTFVKDLMFSDRVYQRTVNALRQEGDDNTSCLIVQMENSYVLWHEDKVQPRVDAPAQKTSSHRLPPLSTTTSRLTTPAPLGISPSSGASSNLKSSSATSSNAVPPSPVSLTALPLEDSPVPESNLIIELPQSIALTQRAGRSSVGFRESAESVSSAPQHPEMPDYSPSNRKIAYSATPKPAAALPVDDEPEPTTSFTEDIANLIAPLVEQAVEAALTRKSSVTAEQMEQIVNSIKDNLISPAAQPAQPAQDLPAPFDAIAPSSVPQPEPPQTKPLRRVYRGVIYYEND